jgi:hypothetical protein
MSIRNHTWSGPEGNGGASAARVYEAFREQDERRREELDRLIREGPVTVERRVAKRCPECDSPAIHRRGCSKGPPVIMCPGPECDRMAAGGRGYCHAHLRQLREGKALTPLRPWVPRARRDAA